MRIIISSVVFIALFAPLAGCHGANDNSDYIVSNVQGTYVECISPASLPFQVAIESGSNIAEGDVCPDGEHR